MKSFFNEKSLIEALSLAVDESIAKVKSNIMWYTTNSRMIIDWLTSNNDI